MARIKEEAHLWVMAWAGVKNLFFLTENDFFFTEGSEESSRALSVARIIPFFLWSGIILTPTACEYIRQPSYLAFQKKKTNDVQNYYLRL